MTIRAVLEGNPRTIITIDVNARVSEAVTLLAEKRIGALPVLDGGKIAGIFSERDVVYGLARNGAAALERRVGDVMTAPAVTVNPEETTIGALSLMTKRRIRHLPVVEGGEMTAFVSIGDLVKFRMERIESEANAMRAYIQSA
jgi:CBS domain-containing protein